jgi:AraC-like DNA-binding protein
MMNNKNLLIDNIFPDFTYVANRKCSVNWHLKGPSIYDRHNLILVYHGEAELICNDKSFHVKPGHLVYFKPGDYRKGHTFPDNLMECYTVNFLYTIPVMQDNQWKLIPLDLPFETVEYIHDSFLYSRLLELFSKFTKTFLSQSDHRIIRGRAIFTEILSLMIQWKSGNFIYDNTRRIEQVINYMIENYTEPLNLADLSNNFKISPSYLSSLFKSVTGKSPISYLINIRLHKAKELLIDGHTVSETAQKVGFNDLFYFSRCFKKNEGLTPSQYKQIANNNDTAIYGDAE